ncbi:hypothetical protein [Nocardia sp. NPDC046763]|uniref:hypothetical protein n=1 Tax=Nocardia sp. NPDC046763 TaxID=3155256 RepID=UPI0033FB0CBA
MEHPTMDGSGHTAGFARELRPAERLQLSREIHGIVTRMAGVISGLGPDAWRRYENAALDAVEVRELQLGFLHICSVLECEIDPWMAGGAAAALDHTADLGDIAAVTHLGRETVHRRWGHLESIGARIALVISRPWPDVEALVDTSGGQVSYEMDRRWWHIGTAVRRGARHAIVVVDRVVQRVYELDPEGWAPDGTGHLWEFSAVGAAPLGTQRVQDAFDHGLLPVRLGDRYPARLDVGCMPCYLADDGV